MNSVLSVTPEEQAQVERGMQNGVSVYEEEKLIFCWYPSRQELIELLTLAKIVKESFSKVLLARAEVERVIGNVKGRPWDTTNWTGEKAPGQE